MNKGPAVRLQPTVGQGGRPLIFWEQQAIEAKNHKAKKQKFGYKDKTVRNPLRDKAPEPEPKIENNKKANNNKETGRTTSRKNGAQNSRNHAKPKPDVNTVTLTQKQLDNILDTIGHLTLENEELHVKNPSGEIKGNLVSSEVKPDSTQDAVQNRSGDQNTVALSRSEIPGLENHAPPGEAVSHAAWDHSAQNVPTADPGVKVISSPEQEAPKPVAFMTKAELKRKQWELERAEQEKLEAQALAKVTASPIINQQRSTAPADYTGTSPGLSKFQQKKLQWEKERAEIPENFDPWGRPGAGAPMKDTVLTDYNNRKSQDFQATGGSKQAWTESNASVLQTQSPRFTSPQQQHQQHQPSPSWTKDQPSAIRSSFAVGFVAPNEEQFNSVKEAQKKQWLADLEKQKEENRLQKLREKQLQQDAEDRWADRFSNYRPSGFPEQPAKPTESDRISSAPTAPPPPTQAPANLSGQELNNSQSTSYLRGQNAPLDPVTKKELEDKRRKYYEHQDALKAQMEERQRLKREEREQRNREEREEEEKLAKEREALQAQFDNEKRKQREKEEAQKRRVDLLKEAMDKAQQDAEREKHKRRLERLQQGGHDTSHLQANFEARMTPRLVGGVIVPTPAAVGNAANPNSVTVVAPTYIPGLHPTPRMEEPASMVNDDEPYMENRVLTPSLYRGQRMPKKEFGVQTDPSLLKKLMQDRDDSDPRYLREKHNRKVRLKSPAEEMERREVSKGPVKISDRPRWGASKQTKKSVKQSDRDLKLQQQREEAAARRQARQQQMLEMAERNAPRASQRTTNASRARSHSRNRENDNRDHPRRHSPEVYDVYSTDPSNSVNAPSRHNAHSRNPSRETQSRSRSENRQSRMTARNNFDNASHNNHGTSPAHHLSPPVPTISHKLNGDNDNNSHNHGNYDRIVFSSRTPNQEKYQDYDLTGRTSDNTFVPFVRTQEILDPAHADDPVPISREATAIQRARQAYHESHEPANFGTHLNNIEDKAGQENVPANWLKDPIMNPTVIKGHPTPRQDRILQQLSDLRQGLRQKQRELEVGMSTMSFGVEVNDL